VFIFLPTNLPTELPTEEIPSVNPSVILLVKMTRHHFFLLCFNFFSHGNSLGISVCIYQFSGSEKEKSCQSSNPSSPNAKEAN
jgi:hypothetical protein